MRDTEVEMQKIAFSDRDVRIKHELLEFLFAELVDMRPVFTNDFDSMLVYTAISRFYLRDERAGLAPQDEQFGGRRMTASRIADATKIPRETVRRKLQLLQKRGLIEKGPQDEWRVAVRDGQPVIRTEFLTVWEREINRVVKFVRALRECVG